MGDDSGPFQMVVAIQAVDSGGTIYAKGENFIWGLVAQLDKLIAIKAIASIPENVNFGIKASTVR